MSDHYQRVHRGLGAWHVIMAFVSLASLAPAQEEKPPYVPAPLPASEKIPTHAQFLQDLSSYYDEFAKQYTTLTKDPKEVREAGKQFLSEALRVYYQEPAIKPVSRPAIIAAGEKVRAAGSKDPLLDLLLLYLDIEKFNDKANAESLLKRVNEAAAQLSQLRYDQKVMAKLYVLHFYFHTLLQPKLANNKRKPAKIEPVIDAVIAMLEADKENLARQRLVLFDLQKNIVHISFPAKKKLLDALKRQQAGHLWVQLILMSQELKSASMTHDPRRRENVDVAQYRMILKDAFNTLKSAHEMAPQFPEAALIMIDLADSDAELGESPRYWFDQAVKAEFDCPEAYRTLSWQFPGSENAREKTLRLAIECAKTDRFDTEVPFKLFEMFKNYERVHGFNIWSVPEAYEAATTMLEHCLKSSNYLGSPHTEQTRLWINALQVAVYVRGNEYEKAAGLWDLPSQEQLSKALGMVGIKERVEQVKLLAKKKYDLGPIQSFALKVVKAENAADLRELRAELARISPAFPAEKQAAWLAFGEELLASSDDLLNGRKHEFRFTAALLDYLNRGGWKLMEDGSLRPEGSNNLPLAIVHPAGPMEVTLDVSIDKYTEHNGPMIGVVIGNKIGEYTFPPRWFGIVPGKGNLLPTDQEYSSPFPYRVTGAKENKLRLRVWPGYAEFYVNHECVYSQDVPYFYPNGQLELIGCGILNVSEVRIKNIVVTPLAEEPPPIDPEARVAYFTEALKKHDDPRTRRWRAAAYVRLEKYRDAMNDYRKVLQHDPGDIAVHQFQARILHYEKQYAEEVQVLKALHQLLPDAPYSLSELAWCLATSPDEKCLDPERAIELAEKLNGYWQGGDSRAGFALAAAYLAKKDYKKAGEIINRYKKSERVGEEDYRLSRLREALQNKSRVVAEPYTKPYLEQIHETIVIRK